MLPGLPPSGQTHR